MRHRPRLLATLVALALASSGWGVHPVKACVVVIEDNDAERQRLREFLIVLRVGRLEERRRAVAARSEAESGLLFEVLRDPGHPLHAEAIDALREIFASERDSFTVSRLLAELAFQPSVDVEPFFRGALLSDDRETRGVALERYATRKAPEVGPVLESLWWEDLDAADRVRLVDALACQRASFHLEELLSMSESEDARETAAAVRALGGLGPSVDLRVTPRLVALARDERPTVRRAALLALAEFEGVPEADSALIESYRVGTEDDREMLLRRMGARSDSTTADLLIEVFTDSGTSDALRESAMLALVLRGDERFPVIVAATDRSQVIDPQGTRLAVRAGILLEHRDELAAALLTGGDANRRRCESPERPVPTPRSVAPPDGLASVRCFAAPGVEGLPAARYPRIVAGTVVRYPQELFVDNGERWIEIWAEGNLCWIPERWSLPIDESGGDQEPEASPGEVEIDLPASALDLAPLVERLEAGALRVIDPGMEAVGLSLRLEDEATLLRLFELHGEIDEDLDAVLEALAEGVESHNRSAPALSAVLTRLLE